MKHTSFLLAPYIMWIVILCGASLLFFILPYEFLYATSYVSAGIFLITFLYWMYFFTKAISINTQAVFRPQRITHIVTRGIYGIVRHPMYSADIVLAWGAAIAYPLIALWASVCWFMVVTIVWAYMEEHVLEKRFGEEYTTYKKNVPMWIPSKKTRNR